MKTAKRFLWYSLSLILVLFGVVDLLDQWRAGEELQWRVPLIFIGTGVGFPLIISFAPDFSVAEIAPGSSEFDSEGCVDSMDGGGCD